MLDFQSQYPFILNLVILPKCYVQHLKYYSILSLKIICYKRLILKSHNSDDLLI